MPNWDTRLEVRQGDKLVSPIKNFTPTLTAPYTVVNSIERHNVGYVRQPQTFTFTMTVDAIGSAVADLTELALEGTEFEITVSERSGNDWTFKALKFSRCVITSANPSNVVIDGVPVATFNCMCLKFRVE